MAENPGAFLQTGLAAAARKRWPEALAAFEKASLSERTPTSLSWLGFCVARERGQLAKGISLCNTALREEPRTPLHHLLLGRILLMAGDKPAALGAFRRGMECGGSPELESELAALGMRRPPVIRWLARRNPINRMLGLFGSRLNLR